MTGRSLLEAVAFGLFAAAAVLIILSIYAATIQKPKPHFYVNGIEVSEKDFLDREEHHWRHGDQFAVMYP